MIHRLKSSKSRFDSLEDLDHHLPLDLGSTSMRRMKIEELSEKAKVKAKSIAENMFSRVFEVVDLRVLKDSRIRVLNEIVAALKDDNLNTHGMRGVGKMTIVKNLSKQIKYN
ncbi:hypothetical protein V6N13_051892 [Hibiscus sabdariffa]|uniref:Uncharacterized protein n=1 Tax=Hibiscus sabdariffa TaxID=183260 RepID=A0ABR2T4S9_9ROSI